MMLGNFKSRAQGRLQKQSYYKVLQLFQYLSKQPLATLEQYQWQALLSVLKYAKNHSPFYEQRIPGQLKNWEDFRDCVPILKRLDLQGNLDAIKAKQLPRGTNSLGSIYSSGSSGTPVEVLQTDVSQAWFKACHLRDLAWAGWDLQKSVAAIKYIPSIDSQIPQAHKFEGLSQRTNKHWDSWINHVFVTGESSQLSIDIDPEQQYQWLKEVRPDYLITYPSNLEALLDVIDVKGPLSMVSVKTLSEPLTADLRSRAEVQFTVFDTYSSQEVGYIASECEYGGMHLHSENNLVEILNDENLQCPPGESGRVVVTNLVNTHSPLIRYELGDRATMGERCDCGRIHPVLKSIEGKIHPLFVLPNGSKKNSIELAVALRAIGGAKQFQVIQDEVGVTINIVKSLQWCDEHFLKISRRVNQFFEADIPLNIQLLDRIPLHAGKTRHLVCNK